MKSMKSILMSGILTLAVNGAVFAQSSSNPFDQWYRAKYGRPAPTEPAKTAAAPSKAAPTPSAATLAAPGFEQWYLAKYGRPTQTEEARLQAPQASPAVVAAAQPIPAVIADDMTAKTPAEHARLAQSYREQALSYLAQAKEHEAMVAGYKASLSVNDKNQAATLGHCEYYAAKYNALAAQAQELAQLHEQKAKAGL